MEEFKGVKLTRTQKKEVRRLNRLKKVFCPQQLRDTFNEAMSVDALKYAHFNIQALDTDLRDIMNLTDENLMAFDINVEMERARSAKYQKMLKRGEKNAEKLKKA